LLTVAENGALIIGSSACTQSNIRTVISKILELVDQQWSRRYQGEERVAVGQTIPESSGNARVDGQKTEHDDGERQRGGWVVNKDTER